MSKVVTRSLRDGLWVVTDQEKNVLAVVNGEDSAANYAEELEANTGKVYPYERVRTVAVDRENQAFSTGFYKRWHPDFDGVLNPGENDGNWIQRPAKPFGFATEDGLPDDEAYPENWRVVYGLTLAEVDNKVASLRDEFVRTGFKKPTRADRPGRRSLTQEDVLDIQEEFFLEVSEDDIRLAFAANTDPMLLLSGRTWGWDDSEPRSELLGLLAGVGHEASREELGLGAGMPGNLF